MAAKPGDEIRTQVIENEDPPVPLYRRGKYRLRQKKRKKYHYRCNGSDRKPRS
jgi:hypothetical protein